MYHSREFVFLKNGIKSGAVPQGEPGADEAGESVPAADAGTEADLSGTPDPAPTADGGLIHDAEAKAEELLHGGAPAAPPAPGA